MTERPSSRSEIAAAMVRGVQDHAAARRQRRAAKTKRLGRTLIALASPRS